MKSILILALGLALTGDALAQRPRRLAPMQSAPSPGCFHPSVPNAVPSGSIDVSSELSCGAQSPWPWAATFSADGRELFVSMFGGFSGNGGCRVLRLDAVSGNVLGRIPVGEGPEEIAVESAAGGWLVRGFVTCSTASSVVVFDGNDQVLATIALPPDPASGFPTAFPFGLALDSARDVLWVGTNDSSGRVFAIDLGTLTLDPARQLDLGGRSFGKLTMHGAELVLPATRGLPNWVGSVAELCILNPDAPATLDVVTLASSSAGGVFPSAQGVAITCDDRALVAGFDMGAYVHVVYLPARLRRAPLATGTSQPLGKFQGLGLSPEGLLVVTDLWTGETARLNPWTGASHGVLGLQDLVGFHAGPQDVVFSPSGSELILVQGGSGSLARLQVQ